MCWKNWTLNKGSPISCRTNPAYSHAFAHLGETLVANVGHHLIAGSSQMPPRTVLRQQRMSDYQGAGALRENHFFREVYRHLENCIHFYVTDTSRATSIVPFYLEPSPR